VTTWYKEDQLAWSLDATSLGSQFAWLHFEPVRLVHLYQRFLTFVFRRSFRFEDSNTTELCSILTAIFIRFERECFWGVALCVCFYVEISTEVSSRFYQCEFTRVTCRCHIPISTLIKKKTLKKKNVPTTLFLSFC
jgi:hypothetical protein